MMQFHFVVFWDTARQKWDVAEDMLPTPVYDANNKWKEVETFYEEAIDNSCKQLLWSLVPIMPAPFVTGSIHV